MAVNGLAQAFMNAVQSAFSVTIGSGGQPFYTAAQTLMPAGTVLSFLGASAPSGFLLCNGQTVSRTTYSNLFALIGTTYGAGDGSTTFGIPNFQGCFLRGNGTQTISSIAYTSAALGTAQADALQGHAHSGEGGGSASGSSTGAVYATNVLVGAQPCQATSTTNFSDGTNGTPRIATETRPVNFSVNYIIAT